MTAAGRKRRLWSLRETETSTALDLEPGVFLLDDPRRIARSLKRLAEPSRRRKADAFRSAMSMLTFYINRARRHLPPTRRTVLERAKRELRAVFDRTTPGLDTGAPRHDRSRHPRDSRRADHRSARAP